MPRASTTTTEETTVPKKRAPRKRVLSKTDSPATPRPRTRRAPRTVATDSLTVTTTAVGIERKAPTPLAAERRHIKRSSRVFIGVLVFALCATAAGVVIGMSDNGQIDVVAVVNDRNEKINRGEVRDEAGNPITLTIPVQNSTNLPNGGLTPADPTDITPPTPPVEVSASSSTASSSEVMTTEASTSTEATTPTNNDTTDTASTSPVTDATL